MSKKETVFIGNIVSELIVNGISINLPWTEYVQDDKERCCGWFSDTPLPEIQLSTRRNYQDFVHMLAHEYSHYKQWKNGSQVYKAADFSSNTITDYVSGKYVTKEVILRETRLTQASELECEKMAIDLIKKAKLGYNLKLLIKRANAYVYFYTFIPLLKKWYKIHPQEVPEILEVMSDKFLPIRDYQTPPEGWIERYKKCLYI